MPGYRLKAVGWHGKEPVEMVLVGGHALQGAVAILPGTQRLLQDFSRLVLFFLE
jgi:hypothetical protein